MRVLSVLSVLSVPLAAQQYSAAAAPIVAADSVIQWWLGLLARREYRASWENAGPIFRASWREVDWETYCENVEEQLQRGALRKVTGTEYWEDPEPLAGMTYGPSKRGKYVAISYVTQIDRDKRVYERVTVASYEGSAWEPLRYQLWPNEHGEPVLLFGNPMQPGVTPPAPAPPAEAPRARAVPRARWKN